MVEIPWDILLGAAGGATIPIFFMVIFADKIIDHVFERYRKQLELSADIDIHLREQRITVYTELWKKTELLPKWPRSHDVTYEKLDDFSKGLRDWYFQVGGMYLSEDARDSYIDLQETITDNLKAKRSGNIIDDEYDRIRDKCSALRTELTNDILSRRAAPIKPNKQRTKNTKTRPSSY